MAEKIKVLVVDDHAVVRSGLASILAAQPDMAIIGEARDGPEAVNKALELKPDVILMDIFMPNLSGIDAMIAIKEKMPEARVLILTVSESEENLFRALRFGAQGYLLKSASYREIIEAIRAVHAGQSVLHPVATERLLARVLRSPREEAPSPKVDTLLTGREAEILSWAARGLGNKEIAGELGLSVPTVQAHLVNIFNKMGVGSRTEAVLQALRKGWVRLEGLAPDR